MPPSDSQAGTDMIMYCGEFTDSPTIDLCVNPRSTRYFHLILEDPVSGP